MAELDDIFRKNEEKLSDEELLKYLDGKATHEEMHAVEKHASTSPFDSEALEGLEAFNNEKLNDYVHQLNKNLQQQLGKKKQRKEKRKIKDIPLSVITVIIILILCVLGFIAIHFYQKNNNSKSSSQVNDTAIIVQGKHL